jgi:hypothetical protein
VRSANTYHLFACKDPMFREIPFGLSKRCVIYATSSHLDCDNGVSSA